MYASEKQNVKCKVVKCTFLVLFDSLLHTADNDAQII